MVIALTQTQVSHDKTARDSDGVDPRTARPTGTADGCRNTGPEPLPGINLVQLNCSLIFAELVRRGVRNRSEIEV